MKKTTLVHLTGKAIDSLETLSLYELDTDIDAAITQLQKIKEQYSNKYEIIRLSLEQQKYDDGEEYIVQGIRNMTPEEHKQACETNKMNVKQRLLYLTAQYEAAKKDVESLGDKTT